MEIFEWGNCDDFIEIDLYVDGNGEIVYLIYDNFIDSIYWEIIVEIKIR